jgi:peptidoglycan hydrolase-like protein with peptidoglycan-binding domain
LPPRSAPAFDLRALVAPRVLVATGVFVAFLLAVLAAAGVFSSGAPRTTAPIITTTAPPPTPPTTTRPATGPPATTLKPGDTGAQVKVLQRALSSLGYSARALDGQYGPATKQAVAAFQGAHGLTADGIVGSKTLQALTRALGR